MKTSRLQRSKRKSQRSSVFLDKYTQYCAYKDVGFIEELCQVSCIFCGGVHYINAIPSVGKDMATNEPLYPIYCSDCDCSSYAIMAIEETTV